MTEAELTRKIRKELEARGAYAQKIHGGPHQRAGILDILACIDGYFYAFEVKLPGKERTLTKLQKKNIEAVLRAGGEAVVVTSVEEAIDFVFGGN